MGITYCQVPLTDSQIDDLLDVTGADSKKEALAMAVDRIIEQED